MTGGCWREVGWVGRKPGARKRENFDIRFHEKILMDLATTTNMNLIESDDQATLDRKWKVGW